MNSSGPVMDFFPWWLEQRSVILILPTAPRCRMVHSVKIKNLLYSKWQTMSDWQVSYSSKCWLDLLLSVGCHWFQGWEVIQILTGNKKKVTRADEADFVGFSWVCLHVWYYFVSGGLCLPEGPCITCWWCPGNALLLAQEFLCAAFTAGKHIPLNLNVAQNNISPSVSILWRALSRWTRTDGEASADPSVCYQRQDFSSSTILTACHGTTLNQNSAVQGDPLTHQLPDVFLCRLVSMRRKT